METLSQVGKLLFVMMWIVAILLNVFQPKWYWEKFIPMIYKKEEKHPIITVIVLLLLVMLMMMGIISII